MREQGTKKKTIDLHVPPAEYKHVAENQRKYFSALAERILNENTLTLLDRRMAAGAINAFSASIPAQPKRKRGQAQKFDHGAAAILFELMKLRANEEGKRFIKSKALGVLLEIFPNKDNGHAVDIKKLQKAIKTYIHPAEKILQKTTINTTRKRYKPTP